MRHFIVVFLVMLSCQIALATDYYVSVTGNDASNGTTPSAPWKTITKVNTISFKPGDNLYFKGGESFSGNVYLDSNDGNSPTLIFKISSYGTGRAIINAGNSYGIFAYNTQGIRVENLILNGSGMGTNTNDGLGFYADLGGDVKLKGLSFDNIEVKNFGKTGVKIGSWNGNTGYENLTLNNLVVHDNLWDGILVYGNIGYNNYVGYPHKNVTITNCESYNNPGIADPNAIRGNGIVLSNTDGGLIENCKAHDNGGSNVHCGGPGGIWVYDCNNVTIQYCESYRNHSSSKCDGLGFDLDGGVMNSVMQYNYSHDNDGGGFLMGQMANGRPWQNNICRYNISENDGRTNAAGITLFKEGSTTILNNAQIYNNTVYMTPAPNNSDEGAFRITQWYTGINNVKVYNNIFVTTGGVPLVEVPAGYSGYFAGNLYWSSGSPFVINYQGTTFSNLNAWRTATGNEMVNGNPTGINADPLLTNAGAGGTLNPGATTALNAYKLLINSPALDAGLNLQTLFSVNPGIHDYWNNGIPGGTAFDIGANEYLSTSACLTPSGLTSSPSANSVVLSWSNTGAVSYNLQYKLSTSSNWITLVSVSNPYTLSGLTSCSTYQFQVQGDCGSSTSLYSSPSSFSTTGCPVTYCPSFGTNTTREYISRIKLGTINNLSGNNNGYGNFTALSTNLTAGSSATITLEPGFIGGARKEGWDVYIDYNQNGSFADAGEKVASGLSKSSFSKTFTVPPTAKNGSTRMRIQMKYNGYAGGSCNTFVYGEVEDYSIMIAGGASSGNVVQSVMLMDNPVSGLTSYVIVYPNPSFGRFSVFSDEAKSIEIFSLAGVKLYDASMLNGKAEVDLGSVPKGFYILQLHDSEKSTSRRILVK